MGTNPSYSNLGRCSLFLGCHLLDFLDKIEILVERFALKSWEILAHIAFGNILWLLDIASLGEELVHART